MIINIGLDIKLLQQNKKTTCKINNKKISVIATQILKWKINLQKILFGLHIINHIH